MIMYITILNSLKRIFLLECPAGYYGTNCSKVCLASYYGIRCVTKCECSPCHHVYGCMLMTTDKMQHGIQANSIEPTIVLSETRY